MATKTALGDAGDEEPDLTPQQREAIRKAFSSPFQLQQFKLAESTFSSLNKTINAAMITSIAPALKLFADQQAAMVASMGGAASIQMRLAEAMTPILDQVKQVQAEIAKSLQVRILASEEFQSRFTSMVVSREFTEAMRRVRELSDLELDIPTDDGFDRLAQLVESGEIDEETGDFAEQAVAQNQDLSAAIDAAVDEFVKRRPMVPRWVVRRMIVTWVWLMWVGVLYVVAVLTNPAIAAIPGAVGAPAPAAVAKKAGEKFDARYPPEDDGEDKPKELEQ